MLLCDRKGAFFCACMRVRVCVCTCVLGGLFFFFLVCGGFVGFLGFFLEVEVIMAVFCLASMDVVL